MLNTATTIHRQVTYVLNTTSTIHRQVTYMLNATSTPITIVDCKVALCMSPILAPPLMSYVIMEKSLNFFPASVFSPGK